MPTPTLDTEPLARSEGPSAAYLFSLEAQCLQRQCRDAQARNGALSRPFLHELFALWDSRGLESHGRLLHLIPDCFADPTGRGIAPDEESCLRELRLLYGALDRLGAGALGSARA